MQKLTLTGASLKSRCRVLNFAYVLGTQNYQLYNSYERCKANFVRAQHRVTQQIYSACFIQRPRLCGDVLWLRKCTGRLIDLRKIEDGRTDGRTPNQFQQFAKLGSYQLLNSNFRSAQNDEHVCQSYCKVVSRFFTRQILICTFFFCKRPQRY